MRSIFEMNDGEEIEILHNEYQSKLNMLLNTILKVHNLNNIDLSVRLITISYC